MVLLPGYTTDFPLNKPIVPNGHFTWSEATHGGSRLPETEEIVGAILTHAANLERIRSLLGGFPLFVSSWYRPPDINRSVGGAKNSRHLYGDATDLIHPRYSGFECYRILFGTWGGGLGRYPKYPKMFHIDSRGNAARWG